MKKKSSSSTPPACSGLGETGFLSPRASIALLGAATAFSILTGTLLAFFHPQPASNASQRTLTFEERVSYQKAIEEVYWRHRIWPRDRGERLDHKPSLDAVMSQAQLEKKVTDYLRNSKVLGDYWQRPITAEQLQAEMDRITKHTDRSNRGESTNLDRLAGWDLKGERWWGLLGSDLRGVLPKSV
jgi:hypothetical protein